MIVLTRAFLDAIVLAISAGIGGDSINMGACSIGLLKAAFSPGVDTVMGDVTATFANYDGYHVQAMSGITLPFIGPGNLSLVEGARLTFRPTDSAVSNLIFCTFLTAPSDSTTLWGIEVLDVPVPLPNPSYQLTYIPRFGFDPNGNYGSGLASN